MKKQALKIALGTFIFALAILGSFKFAKAAVFDTNGSGTITQGVTTGVYEVIGNETRAALAGLQISSIEIKNIITNTCSSVKLSVVGQESDNSTAATGSFVFNFSPPISDIDNFNSLQFATTGCGTLEVSAVDKTTVDAWALNNYITSNNGYEFELIITANAPLAITNPPEFSTLANNSTSTISGTCPAVGNTINIGQQLGANYQLINTTTCTASSTFSALITTGAGSQDCYQAYDVQASQTSDSVCYFTNETGDAVISSITWSQPPFTVSSTSPLTFNYFGADFQNWQVGVTIQPYPSITGYYYSVFYGTSTNFTLKDSLKDQYGVLPLSVNDITNGLHVDNTFVGKSSSSVPGIYYAQAFLYDQTDATISSSSLLSLTIVAGASTTYPTNLALTDNQCPPTTFSIFSVDYGQGICKIVVFLFYPQAESFNQFGNLWEGIKLKPPFGWFSSSIDSVSNFSTSTPATTTLISLNALSGIVQPVDISLAFLVALSFIFFLVNRLRKWDFHQ